eukprot:3937827-Rhodomonas_salina.1
MPRAHAEQAAPSDPSYPTLQMQSAMSLLPIKEFVFAGQLKHDDPAVRFRYVLASHAAHVPEPFTPLYIPRAHAEQASPFAPS